MKTYRNLREELHRSYNEWQAKASKHPKFARFDTASNSGHRALGGAKTTIYALDHKSEAIGVFSHSFGKGHLDSAD